MNLTTKIFAGQQSGTGFLRIIPLGLSFFILALIISCGTGAQNTAIPDEQTTTSAPISSNDITTVDYEGLAPYLSLNDDTLRVFNFWATWCKPCVEELPLFEELASTLNQTAFKLYYVSLDFPKQVDKKLIPFLKENPLSGKVILLDDPDSNTWIDKVNPKWSGAIPATVVTKKGKNQFHEGKFSTLDEIKQLINPIN